MICFSAVLITAISKSRARVSDSLRSQKRLKRDIRLAINCFLMNFVFILLNTPVTIAYYFPSFFTAKEVFLLITYTFFLSYGVNFFTTFSFNSLFRGEFYKCLGKKSSQAGTDFQPNTRVNAALGQHSDF